ncbi:hypothetical protein AB1K89_06890 [Sporosarcina sp. 179-K 8C2 HS]|uniref:hypothetical protein n=1 Tax=Sporosarcina sp. 179-K 8C2 HS TaxID=3142387 RepID=UPI0039A31B72
MALILALSVVFSGCSASELIQVGTPSFNEKGKSISFDKEIKDSESIEALRALIKKVREVEEPKDLDDEPETFFSLVRQQEGIAEMWLYVYYQDDGSSILYNDGVNGYYALSKEQTNELRRILEQ